MWSLDKALTAKGHLSQLATDAWPSPPRLAEPGPDQPNLPAEPSPNCRLRHQPKESWANLGWVYYAQKLNDVTIFHNTFFAIKL